MQPDNLRSFHRLIDVAADGILHHRAHLFHSVALRMDPLAKGGSRKAPIHLVLAHLKDDLAH
jgi:hypothetical protein